ncbi:MAG: hypothetical protein OXE77_07750 [Flavobacteriaceae bacterium]|nr:hypothetical protein [Flavobacteriaceae bacterium]MCY4266454.1 hypothetical protein [Flavobacteriaceae bacterium]MCY4298208.1 hypothetical protein [Flavobacteriaceae bacterium]
MAYHITIDVRAQIEVLEKQEQQRSPVTSREAAHQEVLVSEKGVKERPWLQPLKTAKNWQIDNIRLFLLKIATIVYIKKSSMVIPCSKSLVHQKLFHHLLFL